MLNVFDGIVPWRRERACSMGSRLILGPFCDVAGLPSRSPVYGARMDGTVIDSNSSPSPLGVIAVIELHPPVLPSLHPLTPPHPSFHLPTRVWAQLKRAILHGGELGRRPVENVNTRLNPTQLHVAHSPHQCCNRPIHTYHLNFQNKSTH